MKNTFAIVTLSALLSACAVAPSHTGAPVAKAGAPDPAAKAGPSAAADAAKADEAKADEALPRVELSSDLFYKLTKAELDFKAGQWESAYVTMMLAAQQTRDPRLARRASEMALAAKAGGEALAAIRLWRELAPNSDEATQYFLGFAVLGNDLDEAGEVFAQRLRDASPAQRGVAMFQMQQFLTRAKDKAAAFAMFERVLAPYGAMPETHLVLAQSASANGDTARAVREARQALAIQPDSELAILTLAQVTGEPIAMEQLLADFLQRHPAANEVRGAYARLLVESKQFEQARAQFQLQLQAQPGNPATLYALGVMAMQSNDRAAAERYLQQFVAALERHPGDERDPTKALFLLSQLAEQRGDFDAAIAWLDKVDGSDARAQFDVRLRRAGLMAKHGDLDGGRKLLSAVPARDDDEQAELILTDAQILRDADYLQSAFTVLENGIKRYPDNAELLYDFALVAEKMNRFDLMEQSLLRVIAQSPDNRNAYNALGYSLAERNIRLPEAQALIGKALALAPDDPFIMDSMGWVQFRLGNLSEAEAILRRAYTLRSDPEIGIHLGEVLWQKGDKAEARRLWREAQAKDPRSDALKSLLARLNVTL